MKNKLTFMSLASLFVLLFFRSYCLSAANYEDSLKKLLNDKTALSYAKASYIYLHHKADRKNALKYAEKAFKMDKKSYEANEILYSLHKMNGDYSNMLEAFLKMLEHDRMENAVYLDKAIYLNTSNEPSIWLNSDELKILENKARSLLENGTIKNPLIRIWLKNLIVHILMETGRFDEAEKLLTEFGSVSEWMIIGSFDNQDKMGFDEVYPPETEINYDTAYKGIRNMASWRKLKYLSIDKTIDFLSVLQPNDWSTAYALTFVYSPDERVVAVRAGGDDAYKTWVNDELVIEDETYKMAKNDQNIKGVVFNKGWNKILAKVCQGTGRWEFNLRLTDKDGNIMDDLKFSTDSGLYNKPEKPIQTAEVKTVENNFKLVLEKNPKDERALYFLARFYRDRDMKEKAIKIYEKLIEYYGDCSLYNMEASIAYFNDDKPTNALNTLKEAVKLDSSNVEALFRLGSYYYGEKLNKKSKDTFEEVLKLNPNHVESYLYLGLLHEREERNEEAYRQAKKALEIMPYLSWANNNAGVYAKRKGYIEEALEHYRLALKSQFSYFRSRYNIIDHLRETGEYSKAIDEYREVQKLLKITISVYNDIADLYRKQKQYDEAIEECGKALDISPENYLIYTKLGIIYHETDKTGLAKMEWEKAIKYKPDYVWLREYMKELFPEKNLIFEKYSISGKERSKLINLKVSKEDYPKALGVILLDQTIKQVFSDGSSSESTHRIVKVLNKSGKQKYSQAHLPNTKTLKIKKAVTILPNGEEIEPTDIKDGKISFSSVDDGVIIEYKFVNDNYSGGWMKEHFYEYFFFQETDAPIIKGEYVLAVPKGKELNTDTRGNNIKFVKSKFRDNDIYHWSAENSKQIYSEKFIPPFNDISAFAAISTIPSWDYLAKWENSLILDQIKSDNKIKEKVAELIKGKETREDKIRAIHNYVTTRIRYVQKSGSSIFGVKPHKAVNTFADGFGVCKDKAILLITMLKEIDVNAYYALLLTNNYGELNLRIPIPWFNHAMVYILPEEGREGIFVDPTDLYVSFGDIWHTSQGSHAFICKLDGYEFVDIPVIPIEKSVKERRQSIDILESGDISVKGTENLSGSFSAPARYRYAVKGKEKELLEGYLNELASGTKLEKHKISNLDDLDEPVAIEYEYMVPSYLRKLGDTVYYKPIGNSKLTEYYAEKSERIYDLKLHDKWMIKDFQTIEVPIGYKIKRTPDDVELNFPFASYKVTYKEEKGKITREKIFKFEAVKINRDDYEDLRNFCVNVDAEERREIAFTKVTRKDQ